VQLPSSLLESLKNAKGFDKEAFKRIHNSGEQAVSIRINPSKPASQFPNFPIPLFPIPWSDYGFYLNERPSFTFDPLFHAGCYYVQEASSMFLEQALKQTVDLSSPLKILDLCAAPGGKSTHIQSLISKDSLLVSNEVIRSRANVLKDNIVKWGFGNVVVTNNDPSHFSKLENYFDAIVIDAPCSGSGLFRRDPEAIDEWSPDNVQLCSQRQQRILADIWSSLKNNGVLIYSTCSYSIEEDEEICKWITDSFSAENISLNINKEWGIVESSGGYRFWPDKVKGEGFFLACFRKKGEDNETRQPKPGKGPAQLTKKECEIVEKWVESEQQVFIRYLNTVYAWPERQFADFSFLLDKLRVIYSGILTGELVRDKFIPAHALAMSDLLADEIRRIQLDRDQSILYLQRKDLKADIESKGWQLVDYENHPLGWVNVLPNRINNYYPRELRILRDN
jgi:16S rRNA C967 or C1407 C5-methylase (RsmB/RsmF family)/NOL1/NOP2/fmu family ribosome biogenesis protein